MALRFLHTADWQLGKPFARFDSELSARLRDARLRVITTIAETARKQGVGHVFVAGDVWDQETPSDAVLRKPVDRMAEAPDVTFWLLPGNHDPAGQEGLWDRLGNMGLPQNIRPLTEAEPTEAEPGTFVLPAPWTSKRPGRDLTEAFGQMATPEGAARIGLAHGSVQGFGSDAEVAVVIDRNRADEAGLSYLALGDWHGLGRAGPRAWYPGTPEPDRFRNNERGKVLLVDLDDPDHPQALDTGQFDWQMTDLTLLPGEDVASQLQGIVSREGQLDNLLLQVSLSGTVGLEARQKVEEFFETLQSRLAFLDLRDDHLGTSVDTDDLQTLLGEGMLRRVADRLAGAQENIDAQAALRLLAAFARG